MNVLILHGVQGCAGENWMQWLHDELVKRSYNVAMPTLPQADHPDREQWLETIIQTLGKNSGDLIIVGHSLGVTSALDYIEQSNNKVKALVSVSGFASDYGLELNSYFLLAKNIDFTKVHTKLEHAFVFYGDNDPYVPQNILAELATKLGVNQMVIPMGGHLNANAGFTTFPILLRTILQIK